MKSKLLIVLLFTATCLTVTSCASSKAGCKASQGYVGYGH